MKVSNLQEFIRSLISPMRHAGAADKVTKDLEQACMDLQFFANMEVWQLAEHLRWAKEYKETGVLPETTKSRPKERKPAQPKHDPSLVMEFAQKLRALEEKAATYEVTREELRDDLNGLNLKAISKDNLIAIARELSRATTAKTTKDQAIDIIRRVVLERKEILEGALT